MNRARDRIPALIGWTVAALTIIAAVIVRVVDLENNPPGLWQDEASTGLDAWLLWTTQKDRAGAYLPIIARSFGDYPLAGYRYIAAPVVGLLGLTAGNERLVAAVAGSLMVVATGLAVMRPLGRRAALAAVVSAAFCPTWVHFSRYGSEAILLPLCLISGLAIMDRGTEQGRRWPLWLGAAVLGLSAYTYHAVKLVLPLWMAGFVVYQWPLIKTLWRRERIHLIGPILVFTLTVSPSVYTAFTSGGMARGRTVLAWYHYSGLPLARLLINNCLAYFDPGMLFVRGGPAVAQSIPGLGLWNFIELPFVLIGLYAIVRNPARHRFIAFILFWFLLGPLPGGVTYETHNVGRVIAWLPAPQIICAYGTMTFVDWVFTRPAGGYDGVRPLEGGLIPGRVALFAAFVIGWIATATQLAYFTLVNYPAVAERDFQFEISRALLCAKKVRVDEKIIVSPQFQAAHVFSRFHLHDLGEGSNDPDSKWRFGTRRSAGPGELYVTPAVKPLPRGKAVCTITAKTGGEPRAYVFARPAAAPAKAPNPDQIDLKKQRKPHDLMRNYEPSMPTVDLDGLRPIKTSSRARRRRRPRKRRSPGLPPGRPHIKQ